MNARSKMTHRALAERDANTAVDGYNQKIAPDFQPLATIPCLAWVPSDRHVDSAIKTANVTRILAMMPLDADITNADRISGITNRLGVELRLGAGPLTIQAIIPKIDHLLVELQRVAA